MSPRTAFSMFGSYVPGLNFPYFLKSDVTGRSQNAIVSGYLVSVIPVKCLSALIFMYSYVYRKTINGRIRLFYSSERFGFLPVHFMDSIACPCV